MKTHIINNPQLKYFVAFLNWTFCYFYYCTKIVNLFTYTYIYILLIPISHIIYVMNLWQILTNGKYKSVFHRVVLNNNVRRISLPLFIGPSLDTMVSPLPECVDEHHPPAYLVKTYKELLEANQYHEIDVKSCLKNVRLWKTTCWFLDHVAPWR